jgi:hypothetical protein
LLDVTEPEVVSLAELWGDHSPMIACVEHARYIKRISRHGFGIPGGARAFHQVKVWQSILMSFAHEKIRLEDKIKVAEWLGEISDMLGER